MVHPSIYPIYDPPECVKRLVLQNHSRRISKTQGNSKNFGEGPVLIVYPKPEALNQTNNSMQ